MTLDGMPIPLNVVIGDQQAALLGQGGWDSGSIALNFGTSGSVCVNTGKNPVIIPNLLSSVLNSDQEKIIFMLEGTINACNSLFYWLEKELNIDHKDMVWHERCIDESTNGIFIPGVTGIAAPYWKSELGTVKIGLENANNNEIIRAAMESIGFLVHDIINQMDLKDALPDMLTASGGGARAPLLQFIADMLMITVGHISLKDRTAIGVLQLLYKKNTGHYLSVGAECDEIFEPRMKKVTRAKKLKHWKNALAQVGI
jgi:glycerol kinase